MSSPLIKIALFTGLLALAFGGAALAGSAIDPDPGSGAEDTHAGDDTGRQTASGGHDGDGAGAGHDDSGGGHSSAAATDTPPGLSLAEDGLRLELVQAPCRSGVRQPLAFRIVGRDGKPVRDFDVEHERRMHLITVRRDLTGFRHLHPELGDDGVWRTQVTFDGPGTQRVFADFSTGDEAHTLGIDVELPGRFEPRALPHPETTAPAGDGYEVELAESDRGSLRFSVFRNGRRVTDIEPYLGARGHLVALRDGDLAYLHVHPESAATEGGDIRFTVEYPSAGRYRLFLQFKHRGEVRTAEFTREIGVGHGH